MIIDTHTHFYDPTRLQGVPWPPADNKLLYRTVLPEHHKALALPEGVTGTVVDLPETAVRIATGARLLVAVVKPDRGEDRPILVPVANLEVLR